jgi:WD40 repeat protein
MLAFSPDGGRLAWCGNGTWFRVLHLSLGLIAEYSNNPHHLRTLAFSADGRQLAFGDDVGTVGLLELSTGKTKLLKGHRDQIFPLVFSPDGSVLASGSHDGSVRLWDAATGTLRGIHFDSGHIQYMALSPDGQDVATVTGDDPSVKLWSVPPTPDLRDSVHFNHWVQSETSAVLGTDLELESPQEGYAPETTTIKSTDATKL